MAWSCLWLSKPFRRSSTWPVALSACMPHDSVPNLSALIIVPLSPCVSCISLHPHTANRLTSALCILSPEWNWSLRYTLLESWYGSHMVWCSFWANVQVQLGPIRQSILLRSLQPSWPPLSGRIYSLISSKVIWRQDRGETIGATIEADIQGLAAFRHWPVNRSEWNLNTV